MHEHDRCVQAGYDSFTCHYRGVYAGDLPWTPNNPGNPMGAPLPQFPTLVAPPTVPVPLRQGQRIRQARAQCKPGSPTTYLPANFAYWVNRFPGPVLPANMPLPPQGWKTVAERVQQPTVQTVLVALDAFPPIAEFLQQTNPGRGATLRIQC